jgi:hypothetical protein
LVEKLTEWDVDGIITDYPNEIRRWAKQQGYGIGEKYEEQRILDCLERHSGRDGMELNGGTQK